MSISESSLNGSVKKVTGNLGGAECMDCAPTSRSVEFLPSEKTSSSADAMSNVRNIPVENLSGGSANSVALSSERTSSSADAMSNVRNIPVENLSGGSANSVALPRVKIETADELPGSLSCGKRRLDVLDESNLSEESGRVEKHHKIRDIVGIEIDNSVHCPVCTLINPLTAIVCSACSYVL